MAAITVSTALTATTLYDRMHAQMVEAAGQVTSIAAGQLTSMLERALHLARFTEARLKRRNDFATLPTDADAMREALADVALAFEGQGFHGLAALDPKGGVIASTGIDASLVADAHLLDPALDGDEIALWPRPGTDDDSGIAYDSGAANEHRTIVPLVYKVSIGKDGYPFLLMTSIDLSELHLARPGLNSLVQDIAILDRHGAPLVGDRPNAERPGRVEVSHHVGGLAATADFGRTDVLAKIKRELSLLALTYAASLLATVGIAFAYGYRARAAGMLRQVLDSSELLQREAQHRVRGTFQLITSLASLQARKTRDLQVRHAVETIRHRINAVLAVNDKLRGELGRQQVDLAVYFNSVCANIAASFAASRPKARLVSHLAALNCDGEKAVRLGLIVNELVMNAYWHGLAGVEDGQVQVRLEHGSGRFHITVSDNGIGMGATKRSNGVGFDIVNLLAEQLDCTLQQMPSDQGTSWRVEGPIAFRPVEGGSES